MSTDKKQQADQAWDEILGSEESKRWLEQTGAQVLEAFKNGDVRGMNEDDLLEQEPSESKNEKKVG